MTSVLFHWLSVFPLFFRYISAIPPGWSGGYLTPLQCILLSYMHTALLSPPPPPQKNIYLHSLHLIYPPPCTYTDCVSFIPQHILTQLTSHLSFDIYPHSLHLIYPPQITTKPYISFIPPHIYLHNLHIPRQAHTTYISLIPPQITTQPYISFIPPHIYLHTLHLISVSPTYNYTAYTHTAYISLIPPQITTQPTSHLFFHIYTY